MAAVELPVVYFIRVFRPGRDPRVKALRVAIARELNQLGIDGSVQVQVTSRQPAHETPSVGLVFGSPSARDDGALDSALAAEAAKGMVIIPVVASLAKFTEQVPPSVSVRNGVEWSGSDPATKLARILLEELGIEERERRVFISHRRADALEIAEQLHDALTHRSFDPFIDRFAIRAGDVVQDRIIEAIEDFAFLLLLESPRAHESEWVLTEVEYALTHGMGLLIVEWPGNVDPFPGTAGLPRTKLEVEDFRSRRGGQAHLTPEATQRLLDVVEAAHAEALARRRRIMLQSVQDIVADAGGTCTPLVNWRLDASIGDATYIIAVSPRPPGATDLEALDIARQGAKESAEALLVHGRRSMTMTRTRHLEWVIGERRLRLVDDDSVGSLW